MDERERGILLQIGERMLEDRARLDILEVAFINLLSVIDRETAQAMEQVFREIGEEQLMASPDDPTHVRRQNLAAVRLGKRIEAALAKRGAP